MKQYQHFIPQWAWEPVHPLDIHVVGCGGTGSNLLIQLAKINLALHKLGHPGIHVTAWDGDKVDEFNPGRQSFSDADIGLHKTTVLIERINRFHGFDWTAKTEYVTQQTVMEGHAQVVKNTGSENQNPIFMVIGCVDNLHTRDGLARCSKFNSASYYLDFGNDADYGQFLLWNTSKIEQPPKEELSVPTRANLKNLWERFGIARNRWESNRKGRHANDKARVTDRTDMPSCSQAEALTKQDLFVNATLAIAGANFIWKLIRQKVTTIQGASINLTTFQNGTYSI